MTSISLTAISPYIPRLILLIFIKSTALLFIATLIHMCFKRLSSNLKHLIWLALLFSVVLMPLCSSAVFPGLFAFQIQSDSSSAAVRLLDVVLPQYDGFGGPVQSTSGVVTTDSELLSSRTIIHWQTICVVIWLTGTMCALARVVVGKFGIIGITRDTRIIENRLINKIIEEMSVDFNVQRKIQVLVSLSCRVPFTYRTFKPVILLPYDAIRWPEERLRSVLIHELAHVKRVDSLTQMCARFVCSFFWFIPMVWIAYHHVHIEQEKSCDEYAVGEGIDAARYARHILNVVRFARGRLYLTGICISRGKRNMLEKRILHLLKPDVLKVISRKKFFVAAVVLCFFMIFPVLVFNPIFAEDSGYRPKNNEELFGTWINKEYNIRAWVAIMVYKQDGKIEAYDTDYGEKDPYIGEFKIYNKWTDSEGSVWYKYHATGLARGVWKEGEGYWLARISDSGKKLELQYSAIEYAEKIDPSSLEHMYKVYYR